MRRIASALRYQWDGYRRTSRPVMPGFALLVSVWLLYAILPVYAADSYAASSTILCFICAWVGLAYAEVEDPVSQQILVLKMGGIPRYQLAVTLFLWLLGMLGALLAVLAPLLINAVNGLAASGFRLYKVPPGASAVPFSLLLHGCAALAGTATGALLHPRLVPDRKLALLLLAAMLLIGFLKVGIHQVHGALRMVTWLFPPISEISQTLSGQANFPPAETLGVSARLLAYGAALSALRIALLGNRRFA